VANGNILLVQVNAATGSTVRAHLVYSAVASTTTTDLDTATAGFGTSGGQQLTEETTGVFKSTLTVDGATGSNPIVVVATTDGWSTRTVDDETITLDTTGPSVLTATAIGNRKVLVNFNETLYTASSSVTAANFGISPATGVTSISTAAAQPSKTAVLLTFAGTASTGITYTVTANSSVKDETTINGVGAANYATFTTPGADTLAPTVESTVVATGDTKVTVSLTDNSGKAAVDIGSNITTSNSKITSVTKGGNTVSGTITNDVTNVACIFTPASGTFAAGDYVVNLTVADLAGNTGLRTDTFTIYGDVSCSANPATITIVGGTSTITATGGKAPYTAAITSDTTGGATITTGSSPWTLTPGATNGSVTVTISDSQTPARTCDVTVAYAPCILTVAATKSAVNGEKISVGASGGTAPYVYHFMTATPTGAAIDPLSGDYLAPAAGASAETETIMATDANGCSGTTTVKISTDAVAVTPTGSGTASVTITGPEGATCAIDDGVGTVTSCVYTSTEDGVGVVKVTVGTEWAKVIIKVEGGIYTVESPVMVQDVNMDGSVDANDLTPVIKKILE